MPIGQSVSIHCSNHSVFILKSIIGFHKSECNITGLFFSRITTERPKECHNMHLAHYDTLLANPDTYGITVEISTFHRKFYIFILQSLLYHRKFYLFLFASLLFPRKFYIFLFQPLLSPRKFYIFLLESLLSPRKFYFSLIAVLGRRLIIFGSKFPVEIRPVRNADFIDNFLYAQIGRHQ